MAGGSIRKLATRGPLYAFAVLAAAGFVRPSQVANRCTAQTPTRRTVAGTQLRAAADSSLAQRQRAIDSVPLERLTADAQQRILSVCNSPTLYRRLPAQAIDCEREMFLLLTRNPEILVGIWDLMGITKVTTKRTGPYQLDAEDGIGTRCHVDLVYGDPNLHVFVADGSYDGRLTAKPIRGKAVFILHSSYARASDGGTTVTGALDCFLQFDSLGADLVARTLSPLIGRSADHNFIETARFIGQISGAAERNPSALIELAERIPQATPAQRQRFVDVIVTIARRNGDPLRTARRDGAALDLPLIPRQ